MELVCYTMLVVIGTIYAQELAPLTVTLKKCQADQTIVLGHELKFVCEINRNMADIIRNDSEIYIVRQSAVDNSETILTEKENYIKAEHDYYKVNILLTPYNGVIVEFDILKEPLDAVRLKFADFPVISKTAVNHIEVNSGTYTVTCIAEGSNPASTVLLYMNNTLVQDVEKKTDIMDIKLKKWRTTITGTVRINILNSGQAFKCEAESQLGDKHSVELPFKINTYDPNVTCSSTEAYEGQPDVVLTCLVDYESSDIKGFTYGHGDNITIEEGKENNNFSEVFREQITDTKVRVHLKLKQAEEWHFQKEFYLNVVRNDGHVTRESVRLEKISDSDDLSGNLNPSVVILFLSLCAFWLTF